jgi:hypothetical protein
MWLLLLCMDLVVHTAWQITERDFISIANKCMLVSGCSSSRMHIPAALLACINPSLFSLLYTCM